MLFRVIACPRQAFFNNDPKADKIKGIQSDIKTVQDIMMENIGTRPLPAAAPQTKQHRARLTPPAGFSLPSIFSENVLQRGEKLEDVLDKTDKMNANASTFRESSRKLRRVMWWRNVKLNICLCFICLILLVRRPTSRAILLNVFA